MLDETVGTNVRQLPQGAGAAICRAGRRLPPAGPGAVTTPVTSRVRRGRGRREPPGSSAGGGAAGAGSVPSCLA